MMMRVSSRTRHRVARRLTRAARSTPPNPPQMASKDGSTFFFTSESVNEGHPDKLADQVRALSRRPSIAPTSTSLSFLHRPSPVAFARSRASGHTTASRSRDRAADPPIDPLAPPVTPRSDLRRHPRCVPRPGPRLQGASRSPRARVFARTRPRPKNLRDERARENVDFPPTRRDGSRRPPNALSRRA